ncbi:homoserine dehydrogenase [Campylobacter pinnipediorum subsp. pinnipediorum]|uniref:homoserine dehydrogenase n=1 Tax=Campylobacter pinnipediorum TaxID=1965231 RepID=UPI000994A680|nr:homoserine dehydrogenase [Campylobacter pinnipediorum]OPA74963.1 homoserine dehydrogenase [Campylobacter pinnipediorum subsp. pinnipediorum]
MNVAVLGVGTVGEQVVKILQEHKDLIFARSGKEINPVVGVVRNLQKDRDVNIELTDDLDSVLNRTDIDVYVELMGGIDKSYEVVKYALQNKKAVVTANKALLAYYRYELQKIAGETPFGFEASVAGAIPIIKSLREGLSANNIFSIEGIMNGTSNYILTSMMKSDTNFAEALKKAQEFGYAEADPTFDIGGFDAAHKLLILASIAYGIDAKPEDILIEGIDRINRADIFFVNDFEYTIKLLGIAKKVENKVELRVHPTLIPKNKMLAKVDGVMNAISVVSDCAGESMLYGAGAGGKATASAVISDLIDIARGTNLPMLGYKEPQKAGNFELLQKDQIQTKYYFRLEVEDKVGVLATITNIMSQNNLSVDSFLQKPHLISDDDNMATLFFITHTSYESDVNNFIDLVKKESFIKAEPFMMRIEE